MVSSLCICIIIWAYPNPVCNQLGLEQHPGLLYHCKMWADACSNPRTVEVFIQLSWEKLHHVHLRSKYIHPLYLLLQLHPGVWRPRSGRLSGASQTSCLAAAALLGNSQGGHTLEHNIPDHLLGGATAVCSCPSPSSASRHAHWWCVAETTLPPYWKDFYFWSQKLTKQCLFVFPFPVSTPKKSFFTRFVCHLFCGWQYCLLWASGMECVRHTPRARQNKVCKGSSHKGTAPGREVYIFLASPGISACTLCVLTSGQIQQKLSRLSHESKPQMLHWSSPSASAVRGPVRPEQRCDPLAESSSSIASTATEAIIDCWGTS